MHNMSFPLTARPAASASHAFVATKLENRRFSLVLLTAFALFFSFSDALATSSYKVNANVAINMATNFFHSLF